MSMNLGNNRISERRLGEGPVLTVYQKPDDVSLINTYCNELVQIKLFGQQDILCETLCGYQCHHGKCICDFERLRSEMYIFLLVSFNYIFVGEAIGVKGEQGRTGKGKELANFKLHGALKQCTVKITWKVGRSWGKTKSH